MHYNWLYLFVALLMLDTFMHRWLAHKLSFEKGAFVVVPLVMVLGFIY